MVGELISICVALIFAGVILLILWRVLLLVPMLAPFKEIVMLVFTLIALVVLWEILSPVLLGGSLGLHRLR